MAVREPGRPAALPPVLPAPSPCAPPGWDPGRACVRSARCKELRAAPGRLWLLLVPRPRSPLLIGRAPVSSKKVSDSKRGTFIKAWGDTPRSPAAYDISRGRLGCRRSRPDAGGGGSRRLGVNSPHGEGEPPALWGHWFRSLAAAVLRPREAPGELDEFWVASCAQLGSREPVPGGKQGASGHGTSGSLRLNMTLLGAEHSLLIRSKFRSGRAEASSGPS